MRELSNRFSTNSEFIVEVDRGGQSGDAIGYPIDVDAKYAENNLDGIHLPRGSTGLRVKVRIISKDPGYLVGEILETLPESSDDEKDTHSATSKKTHSREGTASSSVDVNLAELGLSESTTEEQDAQTTRGCSIRADRGREIRSDVAGSWRG